MKTKRLLMMGNVILAMLSSGCGVSEVIRATDNRYLQPGALDLLPTGYYDTYQFKFLDRYRITHQWITTSGCDYLAIVPKTPERYKGVSMIAGDIYEEGAHTWEASTIGRSPMNFDKYTRPEYTLKDGTKMKGFQSVCSESWVGSAHVLAIALYKMNPDDFLKPYKSKYPEISITTEQVGNNRWTVTRVHQLGPRVLNGAGGPFMNWLLPIGDTGYLFMFTLGANQQSLTYPETHARMQATFRHLIESVKIEPLQ